MKISHYEHHGNQFSIFGGFRWLSLSKPPSSLALFCGRFDASTSSATTTTRILSKKPSQNYKWELFNIKTCCRKISGPMKIDFRELFGKQLPKSASLC